VTETYGPPPHTNGPAPRVTPGDAQLVAPRRGTRELFPSSWLRQNARVMYDGGDLSGTLLEFCSTGLIVQTNGAKSRVSWDALQLVELVE
jgi:hypothetical protein